MFKLTDLNQYEGKWAETGRRAITKEEKEAFAGARVVSGEYGLNVCFLLHNGKNSFLPLSRDSSLSAGDMVDLDKAEIVTLSKEGAADIYRVDA